MITRLPSTNYNSRQHLVRIVTKLIKINSRLNPVGELAFAQDKFKRRMFHSTTKNAVKKAIVNCILLSVLEETETRGQRFIRAQEGRKMFQQMDY